MSRHTLPSKPGPPGPRGPAGSGSGGASYLHEQTSPSSTWTIAHGLGAYPGVVLIDSTGHPLRGREEYPDDQTLVITFTQPRSGFAELHA